MHQNELEKVETMDYQEYCDYLQSKYGVGKYDYFNKSWNKNPKVSRTNEGLIAHHRFEDHAIMLSNKEYAMSNPYEWQLSKNIIYCDYLEHLLLHILISLNPSKKRNKNEMVGVGGVINFIVPELNDYYSGWEPKEKWKVNCLGLIKDDEEVYLSLLKRFKYSYQGMDPNIGKSLLSSYNEQFGLWSKDKNEEIFAKIEDL